MKTNRILCSLLSLLLAGMLLAGCDASAEGVESDAGNFPRGELSGGPEGGGMPGEPPDVKGLDSAESDAAEPEVLEENQSQITGKVLSIVGNEVELSLGSYGSSGGSRGSERQAAGDGAEQADSEAAPMDEAAPEDAAPPEDGASPEAPPEGASPEDGVSPESETTAPSEAKGNSGRASASFVENGVTQTLLVPVGLELSGSGGGQRSRDYSSITAGMVLRVTLETLDDGTEAVVAVRILAS